MSETKDISEQIEKLTDAVKRIPTAIYPSDSGGGHDETGGYITSLTEAVMGLTAGLCKIADAINRYTDAYKDANNI